MTITEQIRLKLKTLDEELLTAHEDCWAHYHIPARAHIWSARRILREICELDANDEDNS